MTKHRLSQKQLSTLKSDLERDCDRLERSGLAVRFSDERPTFDPSALDSGNGIAVAVQTRLRSRHDAIVEALRRMNDGSYGTCSMCGEPIPYGRLTVMPETPYCVGCGARA